MPQLHEADPNNPDGLGDLAPIGEGNLNGGNGEGGEADLPAPYLRDLSEDDVYERLGRVNEFQPQMSAMESRLNGGVNDLGSRLSAYEKGLPTQPAFDIEKLTAGLEAYDPALAKVLGPLLQDALKVNSLDETTLRPHLDPMQEKMRQYVGEQLVMSAYSPEAIGEIIPAVKDGRFMPEGQRQKDFADWYGQQGYEIQQSLLSFGAPYINTLRKFEKWEGGRNKQRTDASVSKQGQLENGQAPSGQYRKPAQPKKLSDEEAFLAGFNEISEQG
jgi:hypothetical protein